MIIRLPPEDDVVFNVTTGEFEPCIIDWVILIPDDLEVKVMVRDLKKTKED